MKRIKKGNRGNHKTVEADRFSRLLPRFMQFDALFDKQLETDANALLSRLRVLPDGLERGHGGRIALSDIRSRYNALLRLLDVPANLTTTPIEQELDAAAAK